MATRVRRASTKTIRKSGNGASGLGWGTTWAQPSPQQLHSSPQIKAYCVKLIQVFMYKVNISLHASGVPSSACGGIPPRMARVSRCSSSMERAGILSALTKEAESGAFLQFHSSTSSSHTPKSMITGAAWYSLALAISLFVCVCVS